MKKILFTCSAVLLATNLFGFEPGQLNLDSVENFDEGDTGGFTIRHRFNGDITKSEDFFGLDDGSNTMLSLRYTPLKHLVFEVHHSSLGGEYNARVGYAVKTDYVNTQLNVNAFSFESGNLNERQQNVFANLVLQTPTMFEHLTLTANVGYDNYYEKAGAGLGVELSTQNFMPTILTFTDSMSLLAEYYTKHEDLEGFNRQYNAYAAGVKFRTFGHHFEILATNSIATDPRTMIQGSDSDVVHFAFNINRKF